jgi:hypothetical protein
MRKQVAELILNNKIYPYHRKNKKKTGKYSRLIYKLNKIQFYLEINLCLQASKLDYIFFDTMGIGFY